MIRLAGKTAIVTGAEAGIGEAIAMKFAKEGASVLLADLPDSGAPEVAEAIIKAGGKVAYRLGNLSDEKAAQACVAKAVETFGNSTYSLAMPAC